MPRKRRSKSPRKDKILYWIPRVLGIVYILFISIFAADVFSEFKGFELVLALFMHLIPSFVLIGLLIWAWKKPFAGGIAWVVLSLIFTIFFKTYQDVIVFLLISVPVLLAGIFFIIGSKAKLKI